MTLLLFVGGMFVFVHLPIFCDSFSVSTSQFCICGTLFSICANRF